MSQACGGLWGRVCRAWPWAPPGILSAVISSCNIPNLGQEAGPLEGGFDHGTGTAGGVVRPQLTPSLPASSTLVYNVRLA